MAAMTQHRPSNSRMRHHGHLVDRSAQNHVTTRYRQQEARNQSHLVDKLKLDVPKQDVLPKQEVPHSGQEPQFDEPIIVDLDSLSNSEYKLECKDWFYNVSSIIAQIDSAVMKMEQTSEAPPGGSQTSQPSGGEYTDRRGFDSNQSAASAFYQQQYERYQARHGGTQPGGRNTPGGTSSGRKLPATPSAGRTAGGAQARRYSGAAKHSGKAQNGVTLGDMMGFSPVEYE